MFWYFWGTEELSWEPYEERLWAFCPFFHLTYIRYVFCTT